MEILKNYDKYESENALIVGLFKNEILNEADYFKDINVFCASCNLEAGLINASSTFGLMKNKKIYIVGLGDKEKYTDKVKQNVFYKIGRINEKSIIVDLKTFGDEKEVAYLLTLSLCYTKYQYLECKSKKEETSFEVQYISSVDVTEEVETSFNLGVSINNARDLVNKPHNYLDAVMLADYCLKLVESFNNKKVSIEVFNKKEIQEMKMGAFLGVNKGSLVEPRLIHIKYKGNDTSDDFIYLVGKGVMFDTGGYSLKSNMINMKSDMAGAASCLSVLESIVNNNIKCNVAVVIAATDNRINSEALLPDDVITASNGTTIEIVSTDAEGRLTLADALIFAQEKGCKEIIDIATLTGACVSALGNVITGLFGNDIAMKNEFTNACHKAQEEVWELPINDHIRENVRKSKVADLTNSTGQLMGASSAAAFLEAFINEGIKWIHLDIAGTSFHTAPLEHEAYGATGCMVKSMYLYLKNKV